MPLTVALPIFRSSVFISTGLTLMGLPIRTGPDGPPPVSYTHLMKKSAYSGMFGDYSSFSEEYDELDDATLSSDEEESGDEE